MKFQIANLKGAAQPGRACGNDDAEPACKVSSSPRLA